VIEKEKVLLYASTKRNLLDELERCATPEDNLQQKSETKMKKAKMGPGDPNGKTEKKRLR